MFFKYWKEFDYLIYFYYVRCMKIFVAVVGPHVLLTSISTVTEVYRGPASYCIINLLDENWLYTFHHGDSGV